MQRIPWSECRCLPDAQRVWRYWGRNSLCPEMCTCAMLLQSCLTLCDSMDCSPPGSSVHGILQARILEWVTMPSSTGSSQPGDQTCVSYVSCIGRQVFLPLAPPGKSIPRDMIPANLSLSPPSLSS